MTPFKSILAATDLSAPATNAVRRAALLARQHGARLRIVHVVNPASLLRFREWLAPMIDLDFKTADARDRLERLASDLARRHDVHAAIEVRTGDIVDELHRAATDADLLVMGQRRRSALSEWVPGKTAQNLLEKCKRPVLVVKRGAESDYRKILVPIDLTPGSNAAAVIAASLAPAVELHVFHAAAGEATMSAADVRDQVIRESVAREEAGLLARMRRSMARLGLDTRNMVFAIGRGSPITATLQQAKTLRADLMVARKQRHARNATSVLGSVNSFLARTRCDMLIVPGGVPELQRSRALAPLRPLVRAAAGGGWQTAHAPALHTPSWTGPQREASAGRTSAAKRGTPRLAAR